ncbi:MAG: hypothetical protein H6686_01205 [Fibrobacteria bacterium]|nr:hypothetical protein [Fibrobacteria bacterium]
MREALPLKKLLEEVAEDEVMDAPAKSLRVSQEEISQLARRRRRRGKAENDDAQS